MDLLFLNVGSFELFIIILPMLALYIYTIYHAIKNPNLTGNLRTVWIVLLLVASGLGLIFYWLYGKDGSKKQIVK